MNLFTVNRLWVTLSLKASLTIDNWLVFQNVYFRSSAVKIALNHLHFRSGDPDAAAKWYCDNFGAAITSERPLSTTKSIQLELNGEHMMTISGRAEGENPIAGTTEPRYGLDHFGFETDDLLQLCEGLKKNNVKFNCEPWTMPSGSMVAFVVAPDEVSVELIQRPTD
ncbi:MAG: glyoxalase [Dehalococcoidia bacterium]|jgi:extradiol dioxygenase family protein|nr:MAG: VOC family protein [SAR202 cluster bacterium]GIS94858.1 MAG: glyoxalase [Dehalococcoidia bacterium]|tara:strand:- start:5379 stop:5879 length:501 start_codon:yes stop_codon:yes gene_type:complete